MGKHKQKKHADKKYLHKQKNRTRRSSSSSSSSNTSRKQKKIHIEREENKGFKFDATQECDKNVQKRYIGPYLPSHISLDQLSSDSTPDSTKSAIYGPALPPLLSKQSITPTYFNDPSESVLRAKHVASFSDYLKSTADTIKKETTDDNLNKRETWMLELPDVKIALGARKFKVNDNSDPRNRSLWTETPDNRSRVKIDRDERLKNIEILKRDKIMDDFVKSHNQQREKSLLDMHRDESKKKKKQQQNSGASIERRPFDRDVDLQIRRIDPAKRNAMIEKSKFLDSRFSSGEAKYL